MKVTISRVKRQLRYWFEHSAAGATCLIYLGWHGYDALTILNTRCHFVDCEQNPCRTCFWKDDNCFSFNQHNGQSAQHSRYSHRSRIKQITCIQTKHTKNATPHPNRVRCIVFALFFWQYLHEDEGPTRGVSCWCRVDLPQVSDTHKTNENMQRTLVAAVAVDVLLLADRICSHTQRSVKKDCKEYGGHYAVRLSAHNICYYKNNNHTHSETGMPSQVTARSQLLR